MENLPILYSFVRCPYAMRARIALTYSDIKCYLREVDLKNKPQELLTASAKGTVPVLQLTSGEVIDQSLDIIRYAVKQNDPLEIQNIEGSTAYSNIDDLISKNDKIFIPLLSKYKYFGRYPGHSQLDYRNQACDLFLNELDNILSQNTYLMGNKLSVANIAIIPFIRQFALVDEDWFYGSNYKYLINWLVEFTNSPLFNKIMQKNSPWIAGDAEIIFPY
jgi:glutathione S-transferase